MIVLDQITLTVPVHSHRFSVYTRRRPILTSVSLTIPTDRRIALFGPPGDRRTLVNFISGLTLPAGGRVTRRARISFPAGYLGSFDRDLPVRHNVAHVARLYDTDADMMISFVERVGGFGHSFDKPYGELSPRMKTRLGYIVAYCIPFDLYMLSDGFVRAAANPNDVIHTMFHERSRASGMIISTRNPKIALTYCDMALVLSNEKLQLYDDVKEAIEAPRRARALARQLARRRQRVAQLSAGGRTAKPKNH